MLSDKDRFNLLPKTQTCPVCGKISVLSEYDAVVGGDVKIKVISYKCVGCGENWTTNESDIITINRYHDAKNMSMKRVGKINKLFK